MSFRGSTKKFRLYSKENAGNEAILYITNEIQNPGATAWINE